MPTAKDTDAHHPCHAAPDQACIEFCGERCNPKKNTKNGYGLIYAQNCLCPGPPTHWSACRYSVAMAKRGSVTRGPRGLLYAAVDWWCDEEDVKRVCDSIEDLARAAGGIHCAGLTYGEPGIHTDQ